jgi:hypothetical protein
MFGGVGELEEIFVHEILKKRSILVLDYFVLVFPPW